MSLAAFLPLRSPYPHQRSPPDAFSPRMTFSPRPALAPMSRVPRIETASSSRRANNLPRDPSDWVDKDLISYVRFNYSPIEAVPLFEVIERDRLTPTALWYLQADPEQLLAIAEEESLRDTLLGLALSLKPAVSPTSPRIRHVRRLSEDLERPPPPPPPPPPSPPTPEEPELEEDDDVAESVVSEWALDEDLEGGDGPTPLVDDLGDPTGPAAQPEPPLEGLGLHTGEPYLNDITISQTQPDPIETDDLVNLEDDPQPTMSQEEGPEPHSTHTGTSADDGPPEAAASEGADAHGPDAAKEKFATMDHVDPAAPSDKPSTSEDADAGMPADHFADANTFASPLEGDDLENPWAEDTSGSEPSPPPPPADPARTSSPTSDYHDANSTHGDEGERREAPSTEQEPEPSPVHPEERDGLAASGDEDEPPAGAPLPSETPDKGEIEENVGSGEDALTHEEETQPENPAPASSEVPVQTPLPATDPVQPTDDVQGRPSVTDSTQPSSPVTEPVNAPPQGDAQTQEENTPTAGPECDGPAHADPDDSKDTQPEESAVPSTTTDVAKSEQPQENAEVKGGESGQPGGEDGVDVRKEAGAKADEEAADNTGNDEEATLPATATSEPAESTEPSIATADTADHSPAPKESADGEASGHETNEQPSTSETPAAQPEAEAPSSPPTQGEDTPEKSTVPLEASVTESAPSPLLSTDTTVNAIDVPSSPTVRLASGIEAQLVDRDPDSTEQTPSASPSDTPPNASSTPSGSRQASPPAEPEAENPPLPVSARIPSSSSSSESSVNPTEKKAPLEPIKTAFEPAVPRTTITPANTISPSGSFGPQRPAWVQGRSSAVPKSPAWGSAAQSSAGKAKSLISSFSSFTSSMSSFAFGSHSEPTTPNVSQERSSPAPRTPVVSPSNRQLSGAGQGRWAQPRDWATTVSSTSNQESSKSSLPSPPPVLSGTASPAQVSDPFPVNPTSMSESLPPEDTAIQITGQEGRETAEALSDSVIVDSGMPSAENGEPAGNEETSQDPLSQPSVASGCSSGADKTSRRDDINEAEDEELVNITPRDAAEASKDAGTEPQPKGNSIDAEDEDDDEDAPLGRRLARVRQITGDSISSVVTSDTETQGEDERPSRPKGPKLETSDLPREAQGIDSPVIGDSPVVGSPATTTSAAERKRQKKARQKAKANKQAKNS